jgi:hypothetical protein
MPTAKWPKTFPPLTAEQQRISNEFMKLWHQELPARFGIVERFNHTFPVKHSRPGFVTTVEIGAGLGEHLHYEKLTPEQESHYYAIELRENMAAEIRKRFPKVKAVTGDCQARLNFADGAVGRDKAGGLPPAQQGARPAAGRHPLRGQPGLLAGAQALGRAGVQQAL